MTYSPDILAVRIKYDWRAEVNEDTCEVVETSGESDAHAHLTELLEKLNEYDVLFGRWKGPIPKFEKLTVYGFLLPADSALIISSIERGWGQTAAGVSSKAKGDGAAPVHPLIGSLDEVANALKVGATGLTVRDYACIELRVPETGKTWLDKLIEAARRDDLAARSMQSRQISNVLTLLKVAGMNPTEAQMEKVSSDHAERAERAYKDADAMLKARKA